jgi:hypothetical protein
MLGGRLPKGFWWFFLLALGGFLAGMNGCGGNDSTAPSTPPPPSTLVAEDGLLTYTEDGSFSRVFNPHYFVRLEPYNQSQSYFVISDDGGYRLKLPPAEVLAKVREALKQQAAWHNEKR